MTISQYDFWYDRTMVRYLEQLVRGFSGFSYQTGGNAGVIQTLLVPCRIATTSRMVANLMANLSENTLLSVPLISIYQTGLRGRREDLQSTAFVDTLQVFERNIAPDGSYGPKRGNAYRVDRIMPLPFTMDVQVDIWTSNLQQKYMLIEQILPVIYPQFQIQNSDNALDWTANTICMVEDDITFSSKTIPVGTSDEIDVMSINLRLPIWLSPPAKVRRLSRIEEVVANVTQGTVDANTGFLEPGQVLGQIIVTPDESWVSINGTVVTLLGANDQDARPDGSMPSWLSLFNQYGTFVPLQTTLQLFINQDIQGAFVTGTLQYTGTINQLVWSVDPMTLPANTVPAINAVIDPTRTFPGAGLPSVTDGQRYLLIDNIGSSLAWGTLSAQMNDIIQYSAGSGLWTVNFSAASTTTSQYVLNSFTGRQLRWTGTEWAMAIDGSYRPGYWRLLISNQSTADPLTSIASAGSAGSITFS